MLFLIPLGISTSVGVGLAYFMANRDSKKTVEKGDGLLKRLVKPTPLDIEILDEVLIEEQVVTLASEDVILDNRFGNHNIISEHDFSRTADIKLEITAGKDSSMGSHSKLLTFLETKANHMMSQRIGGTSGTRIQRRVQLRFVAVQNQRTHYRIHWKQSTYRGLFVVRVGSRQLELPFLATYGLYHEVESLECN
uniref:Uncharacterized protein n=1 Tax=Magnetococcus massalia (strain MO-1) TaxID=451514 RepID=A0A1S7LCX8_MAGMO|nr:Conserved protein of unknown function. Similar to protein Mmc1_2245 from MC-1 [Candidatus Magnetococcus massalia]